MSGYKVCDYGYVQWVSIEWAMIHDPVGGFRKRKRKMVIKGKWMITAREN